MSDPEADELVQASFRDFMNSLARTLDEGFNPKGGPRNVGFALLVFNMGEEHPNPLVNYISNAQRADMLKAMKAFIARSESIFEGVPTDGE